MKREGEDLLGEEQTQEKKKRKKEEKARELTRRGFGGNDVVRSLRRENYALLMFPRGLVLGPDINSERSKSYFCNIVSAFKEIDLYTPLLD